MYNKYEIKKKKKIDIVGGVLVIRRSNIKAFILGALCMAILVMTPKAYGAVKEYILHSSEFKVYLNGNEYQNEKPVLVYEGNTYIPLRAFANQLGLNINWDNDDNRVDVNTVEYTTNDCISLPDNTLFGQGEKTIDGLKIKYGKDLQLVADYVEIDDKKYISQAYVFQSIATNNKVYMFMRDSKTTSELSVCQDLYLKEITSNKILVKNIPSVIFKNIEFIDYDFYLKNIKDI